MARPEEAVIRQRLDASQFNTEMDRVRAQILRSGDAVTSGTNGLNAFQGRVEKTATAVTGLSSVFGGLGSQAGATFGAVSNLTTAFAAGGPLLLGVVGVTTAAAAGVSAWNEYETALKANEQVAESLASELRTNLNKELEAQAKAVAAVDEEIDKLVLGTMDLRLANADQAEFEATQRQQRIKGAREEREELVKLNQDRIKELQKQERQAITSGQAERARDERIKLEEKTQTEIQVLEQQRIRENAANRRAAQATAARERLELLDDEQKRRKRVSKARQDDTKESLTAIAALEREGAKVQANIAKFRAKQVADEKAKEQADALAFIAALERGGKQVQANIAKARVNAARAEEQAEKDREAAVKLRVDRTIAEIRRLEKAQESITGVDNTERIAALEADLAQFESVERAKTFLLDQELKRRLQLEREAQQQAAEFRAFAVQGAQAVATSAIQSANDLVLALARGEEQAFERAAVAFLSSTGTQLVALGTQAVFKGAGFAIESFGADPRGAGLIALGGAAIATGIGLGAVGAAGGAALARSAAGGAAGGFGRGAATPRDDTTLPGARAAAGDLQAGQAVTSFVFFGSPITLAPTADGGRNLERIARRSRRRNLVQAEIP